MTALSGASPSERARFGESRVELVEPLPERAGDLDGAGHAAVLDPRALQMRPADVPSQDDHRRSRSRDAFTYKRGEEARKWKSIPVIDLKGGVVVRARHGDRASYRPIETPLSRTSEPLDVVAGLLSLHPFRTLYVADLDAIERPRRSRRRSSTASPERFRSSRSGSTTAARERGAAEDFLALLSGASWCSDRNRRRDAALVAAFGTTRA